MISNEFLEKMYDLKYLIRYNNKTRIKDENVAEHSFFVSIITLLLCDEYKLSKEQTLNCLIKAILHDMPETEINDITHDVKEKLNLTKLLEKYENDYYELNFPNYAKVMSEKDSIEQLIVDYADTLSVKQFINHEAILGNQSWDIQAIYENVKVRLEDLRNKIKKEINK